MGATDSAWAIIGSTGSRSVVEVAASALRLKDGASLRAMALPGADAWTFSNSSAGSVGMPGSGCSNKISTALPKCWAAVTGSPFSWYSSPSSSNIGTDDGSTLRYSATRLGHGIVLRAKRRPGQESVFTERHSKIILQQMQPREELTNLRVSRLSA